MKKLSKEDQEHLIGAIKSLRLGEAFRVHGEMKPIDIAKYLSNLKRKKLIRKDVYVYGTKSNYVIGREKL